MAKTLIVARCGDLQCTPESTIPAFKSAIAKGADVIECDVHLTKDGELVVHHDYYLGRTDDGSGYISDLTLPELRTLDAGGWFGDEFVGTQMPALEDVLALGRGRVRFEIDMRTPTLRFLKRLVRAIIRLDVLYNVELTSSHLPLLFQVKRIDTKIRTGVFFSSRPDWMTSVLGQQHVVGWMRLMEAQVAHLPMERIDGAFVRRLHESGFRVHGSNLNDEKDMRQAIQLGVDQFSTDKLGIAIKVRDELGQEEVK
jgi:glycerophosphoryl diester phosphodiesterase